MQKYRTETDSMGEVKLPKEALYGAQTQRAIDNFQISHRPMPLAFIKALIHLKSAAAQSNNRLEKLSDTRNKAIQNACKSLLSDESLADHFPIDIFQTGSGTSTNMNANEVIANLANKELQNDSKVHANDHINLGQSSNDVIPSSIHISAALEIHKRLLPALNKTIEQIDAKAKSLSKITKTGRTHLMDAMPIRFDQSLGAWSDQLTLHKDTIEKFSPKIATLAIGGTAVGTGINSHADFANKVCEFLSQSLDVDFTPSEKPFALQSSQDTAVILSGYLKALAVCLMKISNDLRWMNSGPLAGLSEIKLPELQPGSSIMPGKVNPVIPEATAMVAAQVIGNDATITIAGQSGNFELNVMLPIVGSNLLDSINLLTNALSTLTEKAINDFQVNEEVINKALAKNPILVTALNPIIGYSKAAEIAKAAYKTGRPVIELALEYTDIPKDELESLLDPKRLTSR